jgi:hypothetical protein
MSIRYFHQHKGEHKRVEKRITCQSFATSEANPPWNGKGADAGTRRLPNAHSKTPRLDSGAFGKVLGHQ